MTTKAETQTFSSAAVAASLAVLFAYGCAIGTVYLKAYWGKFGIDPFQFCSPSDLLVVGLAATGVTCAFALVAAMIGDAIGRIVGDIAHKVPWLPYIVAVAIGTMLVYITCWVTDGWLLTVGVVATWLVVFLWVKGSLIPTPVFWRRFVPLLITALVYLPFAVTFLAYREARSVQSPQHRWQLNASRDVPNSDVDEVSRLAGRLGDTYVVYETRTASVLLLSAEAAQQLVIVRGNATHD